MLFDRRYEYIQILKEKKLKLELRDYQLFKNRDKKRYIPVKIKPRTITTEFGNLAFERHIYKYYSNKKWKYIALLDKELNLKKYSKLDLSLIELIKEQLGTGKRYRDIIDMYPEAKLSPMTISRIFKSIKNDYKRNSVTKKIILKDKQIVYIFTDDSFVNVVKFNREKRRLYKSKKDTQIRSISFSTGFEPKTINKKRRKLQNKRVSFLIGKDEKLNREELALWVREQGNIFYENFDNAQLIIGGDGAQWIKNLAYELGGKYILDRFHAVRELKRVFYYSNIKNGKHVFKITVNYFYAGMYEELMILLKEFSKNKQFINYFKNNKFGIINQGEFWNIGVSAESDVSRLVKSALGYGSKVYSFEVLKNSLNERAFRINNNFLV
ncbi:Mbov_0401 family ICE element transposase-like protein [Spiroplasma endosymbiont of Labia minor]|uniref:Mbov_0401 family ICE element transposase-like protein n=1 Tax=Spiroplasma endosymbiont of Labia minor TaxID=3066305 RepID=UPI0030CD71AF